MVYARLFSEIAATELSADAASLYERYLRVREVRPWSAPDPAAVYVLSRVTLGADIAVTSVFLEAAKQRFPSAAVYFAGSAKSAELFACDARIKHIAVEYPRGGTLQDRFDCAARLRASIEPGALVLDPDSRLTQLGIIPIAPESNYRFFESRSYGGDGNEPLGTLARRWCEETLGVRVATASPHPARVRLDARQPCVAVSLGVGGNNAKRLDAAFEAQILALLAGHFATILIDRGAGGEEAQRVNEAVIASGVPRERFQFWDGSFAGFTSLLSQCQFYVGYDSAGQHAAVACGVRTVTIFAGHVSPRMLARWTPSGSATATVIRVEPGTASGSVLAQLAAVLRTL